MDLTIVEQKRTELASPREKGTHGFSNVMRANDVHLYIA